MISGSSLQRVINCPVSEALPQQDRSGIWGEMGDARHLYLQHVGKLGVAAALEMVPEEHRAMCEAIDLTSLPTNLASEVAFAWDWTTLEARELGRGLNRDYSMCSETEIPLTIDVVGLTEDTVYIGDYKGYQLVKAKNNAQLLAAALCACKVYGKSKAVLEIINIRGATTWRDSAEVDLFDLGLFEVELYQAIVKVNAAKRLPAGGLPVVSEGDHCRYCPAFDSCPAKTALLRQMVDGSEANEIEMMVPLSQATAAAAYRNLRAMEALVKRAREVVYAYAAEKPIELGEGKVFGSRKKLSNEKLDGDVVYDVMRRLHGQVAADIAVGRTATKSGIDKAIRAALPKEGTMKSKREKILEEVRGCGGSARSMTTTIDEHQLELPAKSEAA